MAMNIGYVGKKILISSENMNLIIQSSQIAYKLIPVDKRTISQIKRPYYIQKKNLQNITCAKAGFSEIFSDIHCSPLCVFPDFRLKIPEILEDSPESLKL